MKKSAKAMVLSLLGFVVLLFLLVIRDAVCISSTNNFIGLAKQIEWTNEPVQDEWQQAGNHWNNGDFYEAVSKSLHALWTNTDFGVRTMISQFYFCQSAVLESQGKFKQAYDVCYTGAQFILNYDKGWLINTNCFSIGFWHNFINPNTIISPDGTLTTKP